MADDRFKEPIMHDALLRKLHASLSTHPECAGILVTSISLDHDGHWQFDIPPGVSAQCRSAIIREQADFRGRYDLQSGGARSRLGPGGYGVAAFGAGAFGNRGAALANDDAEVLNVAGGLYGPEVNGAPVNAGPIGGEPTPPPDGISRVETRGFGQGGASPSEGAVGVGTDANMTPAVSETAGPIEADPNGGRTVSATGVAAGMATVHGEGASLAAATGRAGPARWDEARWGEDQWPPEVSPRSPTVMLSEAAQAGTAPRTIEASVTERLDLPDTADAEVLRTIRAAAPFQHWAPQAREVEKMARALAREFDQERERAEAKKSNTAPDQTTAYTEFLSRMAARLNELADAIHTAFVVPKKGEPIFAAPVQDALKAVGADFLRFVKEHRDDVYRVSLFGGMTALLCWLNVADAAGFVSGMVLGTHASKDRKRS